MSPRIREYFVEWKLPAGGIAIYGAAIHGDETLVVIDFSIFTYLDHPDLQHNTKADAERWAASMPVPCYANGDQTTIKVVDGEVKDISEGHWKLFPRSSGIA